MSSGMTTVLKCHHRKVFESRLYQVMDTTRSSSCKKKELNLYEVLD